MSRKLDLAGMPNLRELVEEARRLGLSVEMVNRTGEVRVYAPDGTKVTCNLRRKSGNHALRNMVRKAARDAGSSFS